MFCKFLTTITLVFVIFFIGYNLDINFCYAVDSARDKAINGLDTTNNKGPKFSQESLPVKIGQIIGTILAFVGIIFFILMLYAGFTWMTARGNEQDVQKAKDIIKQAAIGLIIVLSAYAITAYLGGGFTGVF